MPKHLASAGRVPGRLRGSRPERRLTNDCAGSAIVEFAIMANLTLLIFLGCIEAAWQAGTSAALTHALVEVTRFGMTGACSLPGETGQPTGRSAMLNWIASRYTAGIIPSTLTVSTKSYTTFAGAIAGTGGVTGPGNGGEWVSYTLSYTRPYLIPYVATIMMQGTPAAYNAASIIRNEPFGNATC